MTDTALVNIALMIPAILLTVRSLAGNVTARDRSAWLFGGLWCFMCLLSLGAFSIHMNIVPPAARPVMLYGASVEYALAGGLWLAAAVAFVKRPFMIFIVTAGLTLTLSALTDLMAQSPLLVALALALSVIPAICLAQATRQDRYIYMRTILQNIIWVWALFWLMPAVAFSMRGGAWPDMTTWPAQHIVLAVFALSIPACLAVHALYVFARYGDGTGFPYDPPKKLVTRGAYRFISNPMQLSICLGLLVWGIIIDNAYVIASAVLALSLFVVFRDVCNGSSNLCAQDPDWAAYQERTPRWLPFRLGKKSVA